MTHRVVPGSLREAIRDALSHLTPAELSAATEKTHDWFRKVANPHTPHRLAFADAAALDRALRAKGLAPRFEPLWRRLSQAEAPRLAADLVGELLGAGKEMGELSAKVADALADGQLSEAERGEIAHEAQDAIDRLTTLRDAARGGCCLPPVTLRSVERR